MQQTGVVLLSAVCSGDAQILGRSDVSSCVDASKAMIIPCIKNGSLGADSIRA